MNYLLILATLCCIAFSQQTSEREIKEVWGSIFIKDKALRDSVKNLVGTRITKEGFERLRERIETGHKNRRPLEVYLFPLKKEYARIEIEKSYRKRSRRHRDNDDWDEDSFTFFNSPSDEDFDYDNGTARILFPISHHGKDEILVGGEWSFEQNFFRGFLGVRFEHLADNGNIFRIGAGQYKEGVFQANYSHSDQGSFWNMSRGRWNPNVMLTPQHIIGQNYLDFSILHAEYLTEHHAFRIHHGFKKEHSAVPDSIDNTKANVYGLKFDYSFAHLDNNTLPLSGVYLNLKSQFLKVSDDNTMFPYRLTNSYDSYFKRFSTYNNSYFANVHVLAKISENNAIHFSGQGVYEKFNSSDFAEGLLSYSAFQTQERFMISPKVSLRHLMSNSSLIELSAGYNQTKLLGKYSGDWNEYYFEAKVVFGSIFEVRYTYIYNQEINNPTKLLFINDLVHNQEGTLLSIGFNIGSLN